MDWREKLCKPIKKFEYSYNENKYKNRDTTKTLWIDGMYYYMKQIKSNFYGVYKSHFSYLEGDLAYAGSYRKCVKFLKRLQKRSKQKVVVCD